MWRIESRLHNQRPNTNSLHGRCPLWVRSCHATYSEAWLLYPRKQTRTQQDGTSAMGH